VSLSMLFRSSSIQNGAQIAVFVPNIVHNALRSATSGLSVKRPMASSTFANPDVRTYVH